VRLITPIRRGIASMRGFAFVGDNCVMEATFTAQLAKDKE
jgi:UDP-3-O-[3-hydroxymyristoyl] N-acetylglucosamine deacetylase/3-hydroxyacyl-[acyl-carrier-protein] dehydratase